MQNFKNAEFVIVDVETTGLSPLAGDRVIEVAGLKVKDLRVVDRFHSLIDPQRPLSYDAFLVNGIHPQMLKGAPVAKDVLPKFFDFLSDTVLVGHNLKFDLGFLYSEATLTHTAWPGVGLCLDTVRLARWIFPELRRYRLDALAQLFEFDLGPRHRALADVELTFKVFIKLLEHSFRRDVSDLEGLASYAAVSFPGRGPQRPSSRFSLRDGQFS